MEKFKIGDKLKVVVMKPKKIQHNAAGAGWIKETELQLGDVVSVVEVSKYNSVKVEGEGRLWLNGGHFEKITSKTTTKDPLTIRKITCKSTGLPISRVREIKRELRKVYKRAVEKGIRSNYDFIPAKEQFEAGIRVWDCFTFSDHEDLMSHEEWCALAWETEE